MEPEKSEHKPNKKYSEMSEIKSENTVQSQKTENKPIVLSQFKTRQEKERALFSYIDPHVTQMREIPFDPVKEATCCFCCNKKPVAPQPNENFNFIESSDPQYQLDSLYFIYNPFSGNGRGKKNVPQIKKALNNSTVKVLKQQQTERANHAYDLALEDPLIDQADMILVTGGDGTLKEVINGLVERARRNGITKTKPVGYVPGGTANCQGQTLYGLDKRYKVDEVMKQILNGKPYFMDLMGVEYLNNQTKQREKIYGHLISAWGLGVAANTTASKLRCLGPLRYDVGILWQIMKGGIKKVYLQIDDNKEVELKTHLILIVNNKYIADQLNITPFGKIDDGYLDVVIFEDQGRMETLNCFDDLKRNGAHVYHERGIYGQFKKLKLRTEEPTLTQIDGESDLYMESPFEFEVLPKFLQIIH